MEKRELLFNVGRNIYWCRHYGKLWKSLDKLKLELPYDPAILLLGIYLEKAKTITQKNTCALVFIAALFTTDKTWKQLKCSSTVEWTDSSDIYHIKEDIHTDMWVCIYMYIHNGILLSHKKMKQCHFQLPGWIYELSY